MNSKKYLMQLAKINAIVDNKIEEIQKWKEISMNTSINLNSEKVQSSSNKQRMENAIINYVQIQSEIEEEILKQMKKRREIIQSMEQLTDALEYKILYKRYVEDKDFKLIASEIGKSRSLVTTKHGNGLVALQEILERKEKKCTDL